MRYLLAFITAFALHLGLLRWAPAMQAPPAAKRVEMAVVHKAAPPPAPLPPAPPAAARKTPRLAKMVAAAPALTAPVTVESPSAPALVQGEMAVAEPVAPARVTPVVDKAAEPALDAGAFRDYRSSVHGRVASLKKYPLQARRMHIEGVTTVKFRIRRDGTLDCPPEVITSSHPLLDAEALRMVQAAAPFLPLPRGTNETEEFRVSINFALNG